MKKLSVLLAVFMLTLTFSACSGGDNDSGTVSVTSSEAVASATPEPGTPGLIQPRNPGTQVVEETVYVQNNSGAEEGYEPTLRLLDNGNFELSVFMYDGTAFLSGTYTQEEGAYVLDVTESSAQGFVASDVGQLRMEIVDEGLAYSGPQIGVTVEGAVFILQQ